MSSSPLSDFVRRRARELGLSQGELATRAGLSRQSIVKILNGDVRDPRITTVISLARALAISPFYVLRLWLSGHNSGLNRAVFDISGDHCSYAGGEAHPNGVIVGAGQMVEMRCAIQNSGDTAWSDRQLRCINPPNHVAGLPMLSPVQAEIPIPTLAPGQVHDVQVTVVAPTVPGLYASYWKMVDKDGVYCFPDLPPLDFSVTVISF